jgi:hypothetical protein
VHVQIVERATPDQTARPPHAVVRAATAQSRTGERLGNRAGPERGIASQRISSPLA